MIFDRAGCMPAPWSTQLVMPTGACIYHQQRTLDFRSLTQPAFGQHQGQARPGTSGIEQSTFTASHIQFLESTRGRPGQGHPALNNPPLQPHTSSFWTAPGVGQARDIHGNETLTLTGMTSNRERRPGAGMGRGRGGLGAAVVGGLPAEGPSQESPGIVINSNQSQEPREQRWELEGRGGAMGDGRGTVWTGVMGRGKPTGGGTGQRQFFL